MAWTSALVGERVRSRREELGWSQDQLAAAMGQNNVWICRLEKGRRSVRLDELPELASALGVSVEFLLYGPVPTPKLTPPTPARKRAA